MEARVYVLPLAALLGLAAGIGAGKLGSSSPASASAATEPSAAAPPPKHGGTSGRSSSTQSKITFVKPGPLPKSTDTVETLLQLERGPLYARLGLWLLDATEEDMAAFWEGYYKREDPNDTIKDLVFTQWGKKNAAGMLAMARRTGCEVSAMWSWSLVDPQGMLAYIEGKDPAMRNYGLRGLAYFHPELAREMLGKDPTLAGTFDMEQLAAALCKGDPEAEMDFMAKYRNDASFSRQALKKWASEDPHGAFAWLSERGGEGDYARREVLETVKAEHPELLPELAATLPAGSMRRQIEALAFLHLAETDPDKAVEEAAKIEVPRLAAERLAMLGKTLVGSDPTRAFEILGQLFEKCPDAATRLTQVFYPGGSGGSPGGRGGGIEGVPEFIWALAERQPQQMMQAMLDLEAQNPPVMDGNCYTPAASRQVAMTWAVKDLEAFTAWSQSQATPELRDMGAKVASGRLRDTNDYEGAAMWALSISDEGAQRSELGNVVGQWVGHNRVAAQRWAEETDLPEAVRKSLNSYFPAGQE